MRHTTTRWNEAAGRNIRTTPAVEQFLDEIESVFRKHRLALVADYRGDIIEPTIVEFDEQHVDTLRDADLNITVEGLASAGLRGAEV